jgi:curved DNA-binding protein CbpA
MADPLQVLGLTANADTETIRQRYLQLVREFPPEREPDRFREIRNAYEVVLDPVRRMKWKLFKLKPEESLRTFTEEFQPDFRSPRLPTELLLSLIR